MPGRVVRPAGEVTFISCTKLPWTIDGDSAFTESFIREALSHLGTVLQGPSVVVSFIGLYDALRMSVESANDGALITANCSPPLRRRVGPETVKGGTVVFWIGRACWLTGACTYARLTYCCTRYGRACGLGYRRNLVNRPFHCCGRLRSFCGSSDVARHRICRSIRCCQSRWISTGVPSSRRGLTLWKCITLKVRSLSRRSLPLTPVTRLWWRSSSIGCRSSPSIPLYCNRFRCSWLPRCGWKRNFRGRTPSICYGNN